MWINKVIFICSKLANSSLYLEKSKKKAVGNKQYKPLNFLG